MKKFLTTALSLAVSAGMLITPANAQNKINVTINGNPVQFDEPPIIRNERTLVPVRAIFEAMGMSVNWDESTGKILAMGDHLIVTMFIGGNHLGCGSSDGDVKLYPMDITPCIINDRTYVPVRFIAEATGYNVSWNGDTQTVVISGEMKNPYADEETFEIKGSLEFYENYTDVVDFGKLNNQECIESYKTDTGYYYKYITTGADVVNYIYAIKSLGYVMGPDPIQMLGLTIMGYEKDGRTIHVSYDKSTKTGSVSISD